MQKEGLKIGIGSLFCGLLPKEGDILTGNAFGVANTAIRCADSSFQRIDQFAFKRVFPSASDFATGAFNQVVAPLVKDALAGETSMCVIGGPASFDVSKYLLSQQGMQGFLSSTANSILQGVHEEAHGGAKQKTVTFSWFRIDCTEREAMIDVCDQRPKEMVLRELGNGRGLAPYDLAEIEVTSGNEVDVLVKAVLESVRNSNHSSGEAHSIIQFKITPKASKQSASSVRSGAGKLLDPVGTGRLYFLLLSDTSSQKQLLTGDGSIGKYPWVDKISTVMDWLDSKRATPPFRNSRLLLFMRDALYGRQSSSFLLLLHPTLEYLQSNHNWLELSQRICRDTLHDHMHVTSLAGPALAGSAIASPSATAGNFKSFKPDPHDVALSLTKPPPPPPPPPARTASTSTAPSTITSNGGDAPRDRYQALAERSKSFGSNRGVGRPGSAKQSQIIVQDDQRDRSGSGDENSGSANNPFAPGNYTALTTDGPPVDSDDESSGRMNLMQINGDEKSQEAKPFSTGQSDDVGVILSELNAELAGRTNISKRPLSNTKPSMLATTAGTGYGVPSPSSSSRSPFSSQYPAPLSAVRGQGLQKYNESEMILAASLDVARKESDALRQKLSESNEKLTLCQAAYDSLVTQLREEGSLLMKKEQERFKKCMQDLRDYEVYKRVMEAAMVRMQKEVENLKAENDSIRASKESVEYAVRKQKSAVHKTTREAVKSSDRVRELEMQVAKLENDCKRLTKEREIAVLSLAQAKAEASRNVSQLSTDLGHREADMKDMARRLHESESRFKALEEDKNQVEDILTQEIEDLRRTREKSLEMIMSYQEENDLLRSEVAKYSALQIAQQDLATKRPARSNVVDADEPEDAGLSDSSSM